MYLQVYKLITNTLEAHTHTHKRREKKSFFFEEALKVHFFQNSLLFNSLNQIFFVKIEYGRCSIEQISPAQPQET